MLAEPPTQPDTLSYPSAVASASAITQPHARTHARTHVHTHAQASKASPCQAMVRRARNNHFANGPPLTTAIIAPDGHYAWGPLALLLCCTHNLLASRTCSPILEPLPHYRGFQCCLIIWMLKTTRIPELAKGDCSSIRHPQRYPATQSVWRSMRWHLSACERSSESILGELSQRCFSLMYNQLRHGITLPAIVALNRLLIADTPRPVTLTIAFVHLRTFICRCRGGPPATATPIVARFAPASRHIMVTFLSANAG